MTAFTATLLSRIDWRRLSKHVAREQSNREHYAPVVSAYRWWARRSHGVMGALLDSAIERYGRGMMVSDPFSGGGTVAFEAVRRGLKVYSQDVYPWPADGLATALSPAKLEELEEAAGLLFETLQAFRASYQRHDGRELSHILRVRVCSCPNCRADIHMFPKSMVSLASRRQAEKNAYFGCVRCGSVSLRSENSKRLICSQCHKRLIDGVETLTACPHCDAKLTLKQLITTSPCWKAVLVQELVTNGGHLRAMLRRVQGGDPVGDEDASSLSEYLSQPILPGKETKRLADTGFRSWGDLYTRRQVNILLKALDVVRKMSASDAVRDRLAYATLGLAEMPAFLSRWDRFHLKPFEAMANHHYASTTLAVESNPLSPVGRGTLRRRLESACAALEWLQESCSRMPAVKRVARYGRRSSHGRENVVVAIGSSATQALPDKSIQLTLTDPPYFDDVQYGELARLFHVWLGAYRHTPPVDESQEAVPNSTRGKGAKDYEKAIAACLKETHRTLASNGRLVLTFHNTKMAAWQALAGALSRAGFMVLGIAVVQAENRADHSKRYAGSMLHDLVIECVHATAASPKLQVALKPTSAAEKNLVAMGRALAAAVAERSPEGLPDFYRRELDRLRSRKVLVA
ncbi:hypothetical protein [Candidatus Methylomirabilis sp.]|uniref:hypothetical protein n=1 Tax=Candidatus Methylomirabilis sp. TaxID=2032687 RepID=UPI0030764F64